MFGNCNHCCFCCGHPFTMFGVSLFISCKNKIQCVCVEKKTKHYDVFPKGNLSVKQLLRQKKKINFMGLFPKFRPLKASTFPEALPKHFSLPP